MLTASFSLPRAPIHSSTIVTSPAHLLATSELKTVQTLEPRAPFYPSTTATSPANLPTTSEVETVGISQPHTPFCPSTTATSPAHPMSKPESKTVRSPQTPTVSNDRDLSQIALQPPSTSTNPQSPSSIDSQSPFSSLSVSDKKSSSLQSSQVCHPMDSS